MKQNNGAADRGAEMGSHGGRFSLENGLLHDDKLEHDTATRSSVFTLTCDICNKRFKSDSTLFAHVLSPRHRWKQERFVMASRDKHKTEQQPANVEDLMNLKDEGLACRHDDPKKAVLLLSKAGKGFAKLNQSSNAKDCFSHALDLAKQFLRESQFDYENEVFDEMKDPSNKGNEVPCGDSSDINCNGNIRCGKKSSCSSVDGENANGSQNCKDNNNNNSEIDSNSSSNIDNGNNHNNDDNNCSNNNNNVNDCSNSNKIDNNYSNNNNDDNCSNSNNNDDTCSNSNTDNNSSSTDKEIVENEDEFRERTQTRPRVKRFKMEQMNRMYSDYKLQRGTADLYETMIKCYAESFDIYLDDGTEPSENGQKRSLEVSEILMNRDLVLKELADTEKTYVEALEYLVQTIIPVFNESESQVIKDIKEDIFANIEELYQWHCSVFFDKIEDCLEDPELLGPTFKEHEKQLTNLYEVYCQNKPRADDMLIQYADEIDQVYQNIETSFTMLDFLIKPVQRVMKYQLLLQSIFKYTKKMGERTDSMKAALEVMEIVPKKVNDKMHIAMIIGYPKRLEKDELVLQDTLNVSFGGGKTKSRPYRLFLFSKFILFTEPVERLSRLPQYKFCLELKTSRMGVTKTVENDRLKFAIWARKFKTTDIYVCTADTQETKESWLKALGNVLSIHGAAISTDSIKYENTSQSRGTLHNRTWSPEQIVRQATIGHPREYSMSTKLKANIQKFLMEELNLNAQETDAEKDSDGNNGSEIKCAGSICLKDGDKDRLRPEESVSSECDDSIRQEESRCNCQGNQTMPIRLIDNEDESKSKKGFRLWRSIKEKNRSILRQEKRTLFGRKGSSHRSLSLPTDLREESMEALQGIREESLENNLQENTALSGDNEILEFKIIAAETSYLLVQSEDSLSWESAEKLLIKSLGLFYDVRRLKQFSKDENNHHKLLRFCEECYLNLRQKNQFADRTRESDEKFYSYKGLFDFLMSYADLSAGNSASFWPVLLYAMATTSARLESEWIDVFNGYRKLSKIYKIRKKFEYSVECSIEAYQVQLSMNEISSAANCLRDALETALIAGSRINCQKLQTMALKLLKKSKDMEIEAPSLKLLTEMSFAYKQQNYSWFNDNYFKICEGEDSLRSHDKPIFKDLYLHLLEDLKEKKQRLSGEVFV